MRKWLIYLSLILLFLSFVNAISTSQIVAYYTFDDDVTEGTNSGEDVNDYNMTINGATTGYSCKLRECYYYTSNDYLAYADESVFEWGTEDFTIAFWILKNDTPNSQYQMWINIDDSGGAAPYFRIQEFGTDNEIRVYWKDSSNNVCQFDYAVSSIVNSAWHLVVLSNTGGCDGETFLYYDNTTQTPVTVASDQNADMDFAVGDALELGRYSGGSQYMTGYFDELSFWHRNLSQSDVNDLYNDGIGCAYPFSCGGSLPSANYSLLINHNMLNTSNITSENLTITFNGTVIDSHSIFNCTIIEGSTNYTKYDVDLNNLQTFIYNFSEVEQMFNFTINCVNNNTQNITGMYFYEVDRVNPKLATNFSNNTMFWKDDSYGFEFNCSDTNLYAHAINSTIKDDFIDNLGGTTNVYLLNLTNSAEGNFSIVQECWDSHTKTSISDYNISYSSHELVFDSLTISSPNATKIEFEKLDDRYEFFIDTKGLIYVECEDLVIIENSKYKGHLVCWKEKKWVDFENYENQDVIVKRISENEVSVLTDAKTFKSVGDLNYAQEGYIYEVVEELPYRLSLIDARVIELEEAKRMIWVIMLWIFGTFGAFILLQSKNYQIGTLYWYFGMGLDLLLLNQVYDVIGNPASTDILGFGIGIFYVVAILFLLFRVFTPIMIKRKVYVKY